MRFTFVAALAACQSMAMRPELSRYAVSQGIARVGDIVSTISSPSDSLVALNDATSILNDLLAGAGNATDHISGDDAELLNSVISLVEKTIYSSMDASHQADLAELNEAIHAASQCNADVAHRQSPEGDLGILHQAVQDKQAELNRLQGVVDDKMEINTTKWEAFDSHMQLISNPPVCPGLPARTMPALDVFFEKSEYSIWFTAQQASYSVVRDAFVAADSALEAAIQAYNIQKAVRDVQYCDWKNELEAACAAFDTCFSEASDFYTKTLVPRVTADMEGRIEVKKAGDTLTHQIKFLLGNVADQQTPPIDTSRYEIAFPDLPPKGLCDLSPLDADEWVPTPVCKRASLMDGCLPGSSTLSGWGVPRETSADERTGEAVCCNANGKATRHFTPNGQGLFSPADPHKQCSTTSGGRLFEGDTPSHTFFEAKAICDRAGLRLCSTQAELNTACNTGCWINEVLVWVE